MNYPAKLLAAAAVALVAVAMVASAANATTPAPGFEGFAGCPSPAENPKITTCIRSVVTGGHVKIGKKEVPIEQPITLSGGVEDEAKNFSFNSKGGLSLVKQKVPGGVIGLTGLTWLLEFLGSEALTLYAVTELAGTPNISIALITLPVKVHLINSVLGNNCRIGSSSSPVTLNLSPFTTGGVFPEGKFDPTTEIFTLNHGTYVDNSFAAPGANGCVLTLFGFIPISINGLVNEQVGLPSPSGANEAVQNIDTEFAFPRRVYP
jgi:hypothetical protein